MSSDGFDSRVSTSRQISLTRPPQLSHRLVTEVYTDAESEQAAIQRCMEDVVEWNERNVLPLDILEMAHQFARLSSGSIDAETDNGDVMFACDERDVELRLVVPDDADLELEHID